ncbi:MAG: hypothetical protein NT155_01850 [Candidatus Staskawiczbacteria bacterium]|nr:hypothetical protein [Candidatus Staskawiczbacteria bacterium]
MKSKNYISILIIVLIATGLSASVCLATTYPTTKSQVWTNTDPNALAFAWWGQWLAGLNSRTVNITYSVGVKNLTTGDNVSNGGTVNVGDQLLLSFTPHAYTDINWFSSGYTFSGSTGIPYDSPFGKWDNFCTNIYGNLVPCGGFSACGNNDFVQRVNTCGCDINVYASLVIAPPTETITDADSSGGMVCGNLTTTADGGTMTCTVTIAGTINPTFNFNSTVGRYYYSFQDLGVDPDPGYWTYAADGIHYCSLKIGKGKCFDNYTGYGFSSYAMAAIGHPVAFSSCAGNSYVGLNRYDLNVPAQTIPYSLTAVSTTPSDYYCGTANGTTVYNTTSPSSNLCANGAAIYDVCGPLPAYQPCAVTPDKDPGFDWLQEWYCSLPGNYGAIGSWCSAYNVSKIGQCGTASATVSPASATTFTTAPTTNLCAYGTASAVSSDIYSNAYNTGYLPWYPIWRWTCSPTNGEVYSLPGGGTTPADDHCIAWQSVPYCGPADGIATTTAPSGNANLCWSGTLSTPSFVSGSGPWTWTCTGSAGTTPASCSAPLPPTSTCGPADGVATSSTPTDLCLAGIASSVSGTGTNTWSWTCTLSGTASVNCTAPNSSYSACIDSGLRIYNGSKTVHIAGQAPGTVTSPLRIKENSGVWGIPLVAPNSAGDSGIRIQTSSGIKALQKCP